MGSARAIWENNY